MSPPETTSNATDSEPDSQWLSSALRNTHNVTPSQIPFIDSQNPNNSKPLQLDCVETSNNNYNNSNVSHPRIPTSDSNNNDYNSIICYYLNIRSIVNKLSAFQAHVYSSDFDVVCLSETWLSDSLFDQEILPSNYNIYRNDRPSRGGGVLIATKDNIPVTAITPYLPSSNAFEILSIKLNLCKPIILTCVYIPPGSNDLPTMSILVSILIQVIQSDPSSDTIVVGDFNLPDIHWDTLSASSTVSKAFCDFVFDNTLIQLVDHPTHTRGNILDLILTSSTKCIANLTIDTASNWSTSDHYGITFEILSQPALHSSCTVPNYVHDFPKANYNGILSYLLDFDYSLCMESQDTDFIWAAIKNSIYNAMDNFIPKVRLRRHQFPCWFTPELSKCMHTLKK